jgi:hypothetical protein
MPLSTPPADAPSAYVVDYRPLDACSPPNCRLKAEKLAGWWDQVQSDGARGAYARIGQQDTEVFFRRSAVVRPLQEYRFELEPAAGEHDYDGYFGAQETSAWKASIEIAGPDGKVLAQQVFEGTSKQTIDAKRVREMARYADYFTHVRWTLPAREQRLTVTIRNLSRGWLVVGSPLVLKKVPGRRPRQALVVVTDATPEPLMTRVLTGKADAQSAWFGRVVKEKGTLFAQGNSPGFNSPTFIRRFFRAGFYETDGELALFGQGIDEQPPETPPSPVARLVEKGFQAELTMANFMLLPTSTRLGFDGGYQNEQQQQRGSSRQHPRALVRRFASWISEHPQDDFLHVVWFSATHAPNPPGRDAPPLDLEVPGGFSRNVAELIWRNLLETVDRFSEVMESAQRSAPDAERLWLFTSDHGRVFTNHGLKQPVWLLPHYMVRSNNMHCCAATFEEGSTPFAVIYDGAQRLTPQRVEEPTSTVAVWRLIERTFEQDLELPNTSSYDSPSFGAEAYASRWHEGLVAGAGDSGAIRALSERWAFRSLLIRPTFAPLFHESETIQRLLTGTPNRGDYFLAEELYDREADPWEQHNVADEQASTVLEFRRKVADWLAVYYDPPSHPRYEYTLEFPEPVEVTVSSPVPVRILVDAGAHPAPAAHRAVLKGKRFAIQPDANATSIIDLEGVGLSGFVRCAATGLPLELLRGGERVRLNLALARTNCVSAESDVELSSADVAFRAKLVQESHVGVVGGVTQELVDGLRSWGYVRDLDQAQRAKRR